MMRIAGSAVLGVLLLAGAPAQGSADFEAQRSQARAALVKELEGYVAWCQEKTLFNQRRKACELVLELQPEHVEARKTLGHTRAKGGAWQAPEKPKEARDFDKQALEQAPARLRAVTAGYVGAMIALLEAGTLPPLERELAAREALRFEPDNERVHALLGDVKGDKGWVLPETVRAKEQRAVLRDLVASALEGAPTAEAAALLEREQKIPLKLKAVVAPRMRVVGTVKEEELLLTAQAVLALEHLLQGVFASGYALPDDCSVLLLENLGQLPALLANHPAITPEQRVYYEKLEGGGIQGTNDFAFWTGDMQRRIDGIVRLVLGFWLSGAFEINVNHGWVYEGFGLYLTRSLVRTRMTWLAQPSKVLAPAADLALRQKLLEPSTNWMDETLRMLLEKRQPALGELLPKGASQLTTEDVLYSYALATYLLEARPEVVPEMLRRMGAGYGRVQAFEEALGMDLATFERHLVRWLGERT